MTNFHTFYGCEDTVAAVNASGNYGDIAKLQSDCVEDNGSSTSVPEYSDSDLSVGDEVVRRLLKSEQSYSAPVKNPFVGKWWVSCWVRPDEVIKDEEPLVKIGDKRLSSKASLTVVKGQPKVGKTTFLQAYISALLLMNYGILRASEDDLKVGWVDTEQSRFHTLLGVHRVNDICRREGLENISDRFYTFNLRGEDMESRLGIIREMLECVRPDVVVIDNVADLLADYNAVKESRMLVSQLVQMMEEYQCAIVVVLHTTKNSTFSLGTLGGDFEKKAESILLVERNNRGIITVEGTTRNEPFAPFSLTLDEDNLPVFCDYVPPIKKEKKMTPEQKAVQKQDEAKAKVKEFVNLLELKPDTVYDYKVFVKKYVEKSGQTYKTGGRRIVDGAKLGIFELWDECGIKKFRLKSVESSPSTSSASPF